MSDWKDKTDFEINKAVAEIEYTNAEEIPNECDAWTNNDTECQVIIKAGIDGFMFDPCNDPSDAWPIIAENKIGICPIADSCYEIGMSHFTGEWNASAVNSCDGEFGMSETAFEFVDENPLRAAMIVHLEINGVKP